MHNKSKGLAAILAALAVAGCASNPEVSEQAGRGAAMGAVGGAVAGAVGSLLWGGNVVEGAVKGGAVGAASGAATGAVAGSMSSNAKKPKPASVDQAELRKKIGDKNYASALLLAQCRHKDAIASAAETFAASQNPDERSYALLIQGIAAEESGDKPLAASVYSKMAGGADKARADTLEGVIKVQAARREHGLQPCK
jgi:hypothetical protein